MDHIYITKDYKEYQIKESVEELQECVITNDMPESFGEIAKVLNITDEKLKSKSLELCKLYEDYGSVTTSNVEEPFSVFTEESLQLNCIKYLRKSELLYKDQKVREKASEKIVMPVNESNDIELYKECVITIRCYEPFKYTPTTKNHPRFHQEYQVLGSNYLSELRDIFYCHCNYGPFFDISDNPKQKITRNPNQPNPGFFHIHDTFYNDTRNENNPDYSEVIMNWLKKFHYVREFKKANMQDTKFEDLNIRIGYPCVYQHHGACEHIFCFTSVDLIDKSDPLVKSSYPALSYISKRRETFCDICAQADATVIITDCALHVKDPSRMCERCFLSFHYIDDVKICEFKAYRLYNVNPNSNNALEIINREGDHEN